MVVEPILSDERNVDLYGGKSVAWKSPIRVKVKQVPREDDVPWCYSIAPIVSDRMRRLIEGLDSSGVQFLPIQFVGPARDQIASPYWLLNCLRVLECHDADQSTFSTNPDGEQMLRRFVLDPGRVPAEVHIFRPRYLETRLLVSDEIRAASEAAKCTGCLFTDASTPSPFW